MKILFLKVIFILFGFIFICSLPIPRAAACDGSYYDLPSASYDGYSYYEPGYYRDRGYDNWFNRIFLNRDTRYTTLRMYNDGYNDCYPNTGPEYTPNYPYSNPYPNRPGAADYCGNDISGSSYGTRYYSQSDRRNLWDDHYGSGGYYYNSNPNSYLNSDGTYPICPPNDSFRSSPTAGYTPAPYRSPWDDPADNRRFDAYYRDGTTDRELDCYYSYEYREYWSESAYPGDDYVICRPR